jgi:D-arabinose 1-dehydrogenase-like Zn-dependent alcohol dehydrogenase
MATMRVAQVPYPKGPFELVERAIPEPSPGHVRIKVEACGVCHSDSLTKEGLFPNIQYPRVPGHEIIGILDGLGAGVSGWSPGSASGSAGMAAIAAIATPAVRATLSPARPRRWSPASPMTAAMPNT